MIIDLKRIHAVLLEEHKGLYVDEDQDGLLGQNSDTRPICQPLPRVIEVLRQREVMRRPGESRDPVAGHHSGHRLLPRR